jgi:hypothetical protein
MLATRDAVNANEIILRLNNPIAAFSSLDARLARALNASYSTARARSIPVLATETNES